MNKKPQQMLFNKIAYMISQGYNNKEIHRMTVTPESVIEDIRNGVIKTDYPINNKEEK